jgi:5'-deoxynucleotidase YfbR-like HD superfamily hydrolase
MDKPVLVVSLADQLHFVRRGAETKRFHTAITLQENKVGHHSFGVAWIVRLLRPDMDPTRMGLLVMAALEHDTPEHITGDLPAPSKRSMGLREQFGDFEAVLLGRVALTYSLQLSDEEARLLKLADAAEGALFCCSERMLGNKYAVEYYNNFTSYYQEIINWDDQNEAALERYIRLEWMKANA